jgi:hypothetical protein
MTRNVVLKILCLQCHHGWCREKIFLLAFLSAFPTMRSVSPFEYPLAMSHVVTPRSQAAFRMGSACKTP